MDEKDILKSGIEATLQPFASLIERLFGGPLDQIGGMWEDSLKVRRCVRQVRLLTKLKNDLDTAGFEPKSIPDKIWIPALSAASLEDDETLMDKWAAMLANAADPAGQDRVLNVFPRILPELTPMDARFMDAIFCAVKQHHEQVSQARFESIIPLDDYNIPHEILSSIFDRVHFNIFTDAHTRERAFQLSLSTLVRLTILRPKLKDEWKVLPGSKTSSLVLSTLYVLTPLGCEFMIACQPPNRSEEEMVPRG